MKSDSNNPAQLFFRPLLREGNRFVETPAEYDRGFEPTPVTELQQFIERHYDVRIGNVEIQSRTYQIPVYVPRDDGKTCYIIVDESGRPQENESSIDIEANWVSAYAEWLSEKLAFSEGFARDQSTFILSEFLTPRLSETDNRTLRAIRDVSLTTVFSRRRCILLGSPGSGKTTLLRRWALEFCKKTKEERLQLSIPIYFQLRDWPDVNVARHALSTLPGSRIQDSDRHVFDNLCKRGQLTLLLDGLDEIPDKKRGEITSLIAEWADKHPALGIIMATRTASYAGDFPNFSHYRLEPFDGPRISEWTYKKLYTKDLKSWRRFVSHLQETPSLRETVGNPFFLGLAVHFYKQYSLLPKNVPMLVTSYLEALAGEWDMVRGINRSNDIWASPGKKISALSRIAFWLLDAGLIEFTTEEFFTSGHQQLDPKIAEAMLPTLAEHTGFLVRSGRKQNTWRFSHLILMEVLAARHLVERADDASELLCSRLEAEPWKNVWVYACGLTQDAKPLIKALIRSRGIENSVKAHLLARAFSQNLNLDQEGVRIGVELITEVLEGSLEQYKLREPGGRPQTDTAMWAMQIKRINPTKKRAAHQRAQIMSLLERVYEARGGSLGESALGRADFSSNAIVKKLQGLLALDGELDFNPKSRSDQIAMSLTTTGPKLWKGKRSK